MRRRWDDQGGIDQVERQHKAVNGTIGSRVPFLREGAPVAWLQHQFQLKSLGSLSLIILLLACESSCNRSENPQTAFAQARLDFQHGNLLQSQHEAEEGCRRYQRSNPEWAWKFRVLQAEALIWRGESQDALVLLRAQSGVPDDRNLLIEMLALEGVALAHLDNFNEAIQAFEQADKLCTGNDLAVCGNVIRGMGVLAIEQGEHARARQYLEQSLSFAQAHADQFLEATAQLNLGLVAMGEEHYDEAVDRTESAYQIATALNAGDIAQTARGNLGWAYYNLGDADKSLEFSLEAVTLAIRVGDVINQVSFLNNAGYVYAEKRDFVRAKNSYRETLDLAHGISSQRHIYNALRALALVSVESGDLDEGRRYADEAISIARASGKRSDELYPLLVKGLIAARAGEVLEAERIFREVERDKYGNSSLKWRSEHALARLDEEQKRPDAADREYRAAISTFEGARSSLKHNDSRLPFAARASRIYDDYVHFLVTRKMTDEALRWADYSRAQTLTEGLGVAPKSVAVGPPRVDLRRTARKAGGTLFFYWLRERQSYLWAITSSKTFLFALASGSEIEAAVERYRRAIAGPQDVLDSADEDGRLLYRMLVTPAESLLTKNAKVFILPDGKLNDLNFETLLVPGPRLHYWIEDVTIANTSSLRVLDASVPANANRRQERSLLLVGNSLPPNDKYPPLPKASAQMDVVSKHFSGAPWKILSGADATPQAYLEGQPENYSYIHFVAHGIASRLSPLDSAIILSKSTAGSNSFKLDARDVLQHPLRAELVTISSCYGAEGRSYSGEGLVGLSWAFLMAGSHSVVAALWEVTDASTPQLMDQFYAGIERGDPPDVALREAKLTLLHGSAFKNPFYWAPFQLYTGAGAPKSH